jgi:hypothetical protein
MNSLANWVEFPPHHNPVAHGVNRPTYFGVCLWILECGGPTPLWIFGGRADATGSKAASGRRTPNDPKPPPKSRGAPYFAERAGPILIAQAAPLLI